jgi:hypothetical protein
MRVLLELSKMKAACGWKRNKWEDVVFLGWSADERKRVTA